MEKTYRAVKYIRTSCPDDEFHYRDSVANQSKLIDAYLLSRPDIMVISEKVDEGYSGLFYDRPAFNEMIADIKTGNINCVVVKDLSRIGRDYIETGRYLCDFFPAYDVRLISVNDNIDSVQLDGMERTIAFIKSIFSERYCRDVSVKTRSSLDAKRRQGKYVGAIPIYGYQKSASDKNCLMPDPNTISVVQSVFDMKLQGMSAAGIAATLNDSRVLSPLAYKRMNGTAYPTGGFADKSNVKWSATTILRMLQDENYTGTLVQGRQRSLSYKTKASLDLDENEWIKVENAHPPIISQMDYDAVQRVMALDTRTAPGHSSVHIFSGMLICECCGNYMTRKTAKNKEWQSIYYYCPTGKENGCHSSVMIRENDLMHIVTREVKKRISEIERLSHVISQDQIKKAVQSEYPREIAEYEKKVRDLCKFKSGLCGSLISGIINDSEYKAIQSYYDNEITRMDDMVTALWKKLRTIGETVADNLEWMRYFWQFTKQSELDRQTVVKLIQSIRIVSKEEIFVNFVCQPEYDQAVYYSEIGGDVCGKKEPKAE